MFNSCILIQLRKPFVYKPFLSAREKQGHYDFKTLLQLRNIKADYDDRERSRASFESASVGRENDNDELGPVRHFKTYSKTYPRRNCCLVIRF